MCETMEVRNIKKQPSNNQDRLIVLSRWQGHCAEVARLIYETDSHSSPKHDYGHLAVAIGSAAPRGVGNSKFMFIRRECVLRMSSAQHGDIISTRD